MPDDTVTRGLAAIEALAAEGRKVTVAEVARRSGVHRTTIYRHPALTDALAATRPTPVATGPAPVQPGPDTATTIAGLRDQLAGQTATLNQMSQVIQALTLDNQRLRQQPTDGTVVPIRQSHLR